MKDPLRIDVVGNRSQGMYIQENRASATYPSIAPPVSSGISSNWRISRALRPSKNSSIGSSTCRSSASQEGAAELSILDLRRAEEARS